MDEVNIIPIEGVNPNKYECIYFDERYTKVPKMAFLDKEGDGDFTKMRCFYPIFYDENEYKYRVSNIDVPNFTYPRVIPHICHPPNYSYISDEEDTEGISFENSNSFGIFSKGMLYIFDIKNGRYSLVRKYDLKSEFSKCIMNENIYYGFYIVGKDDLKECKLVIIGTTYDYKIDMICIFKLDPSKEKAEFIARENIDIKSITGFVSTYCRSNDNPYYSDYIIALSYTGHNGSSHMSVITLSNDRNNTNNDRIYTKKFREFNKVCSVKVKTDDKDCSEIPNFGKYGAKICTLRVIKKTENGDPHYYLSYAKMILTKDKGLSPLKTLKGSITDISSILGYPRYEDMLYPGGYLLNRITAYNSGYTIMYDCIMKWNENYIVVDEPFDYKMNYCVFLKDYTNYSDINCSTTIKGLNENLGDIFVSGWRYVWTRDRKNRKIKLVCNDYDPKFSGMIEKNSLTYESEDLNWISKLGEMFGLCVFNDEYALMQFRGNNINIGFESNNNFTNTNAYFGEYLNINEQLKEKLYILNL